MDRDGVAAMVYIGNVVEVVTARYDDTWNMGRDGKSRVKDSAKIMNRGDKQKV